MKKENDGFKMWSNYVEAIDNYTKGNDEKFGRFMRILCYYGIYGVEIAETEIEQLFFTGVKSSIDASIQNIKNGTLGGRGNKANTETFKRPTVEEVKVYCEERNNKINPEEFIDYYQRKGWVYGKNNTPVKDWKACVRMWERNDKNSNDILHETSGESL